MTLMLISIHFWDFEYQHQSWLISIINEHVWSKNMVAINQKTWLSWGLAGKWSQLSNDFSNQVFMTNLG